MRIITITLTLLWIGACTKSASDKVSVYEKNTVPKYPKLSANLSIDEEASVELSEPSEVLQDPVESKENLFSWDGKQDLSSATLKIED